MSAEPDFIYGRGFNAARSRIIEAVCEFRQGQRRRRLLPWYRRPLRWLRRRDEKTVNLILGIISDLPTHRFVPDDEFDLGPPGRLGDWGMDDNTSLIKRVREAGL